MKNIVILSLSLVLVLFFTQNALAIPYMSPQDLYKQSDMVFHGQIISKQAGPGSDFYYQVLVDTYFKNPQNSDSVTVASHKPDSPRAGYPQFEVGDKVLFYIHKISGINTLESYSQKAGIACDAQSFLGSEFSPDKTRSFTAVASNPRITDINGDAVVGKVQRGQPIQITYDEIWNNYPDYKAISLHISVQDMADTKPVFEENRTVFLNACDGPSPVKLNFVPEKNGTYFFSLNIDKKLTTSTNFEVGDSTYSAGIIIPSPLKQFKSGVVANNVICKQDLQLIFKAEDGSPACVKPDTAQKLVERGWEQNIIVTKADMIVVQ